MDITFKDITPETARDIINSFIVPEEAVKLDTGKVKHYWVCNICVKSPCALKRNVARPRPEICPHYPYTTPAWEESVIVENGAFSAQGQHKGSE